MPTSAPPAAVATPDPDAGHHALLDQLDAAVDRIRWQLTRARRADPAHRPHVLTDIAGELHRVGAHLRQQLGQRHDDWPPAPPPDEAP